jgi:small neutral amino acid transporter SnatA (MarC family)
MTADKAEGVRNKNGFMASISMGIILVIVLFTGDAILRFFGISVGSFRVNGIQLSKKWHFKGCILYSAMKAYAIYR